MKVLLANFTKMVNESGGMAKVTCAFANEMILRGHEISLVYCDERDGDFYYPLDKSVTCFDLLKIDGKRVEFPLTQKIKREFYRLFNKSKSEGVRLSFYNRVLSEYCGRILNELQPDIIISSNVNTSAILLCTLKTRIPVITMSHGNVLNYFINYPEDSVKAIELSAVNQVLLETYAKQMKENSPRCKTIVIGNAVPQYEFCVDLEDDRPVHKVVWVGRLNKGIKQPHLLLQAFAKIADRYPDWILELWGDKDKDIYYKQLENIISSNKLENRMFLKGVTKDVPSVLKKADIFAFPSSAEGFGLALAEGMSAGLPGVGYRSCTGVNELITDGVNGLLCDDGADALAEALDKLMSNKAMRVRMGKAAKKSVSKYAPKEIWNQWESLMGKIAAK